MSQVSSYSESSLFIASITDISARISLLAARVRQFMRDAFAGSENFFAAPLPLQSVLIGFIIVFAPMQQ